MKQYNIIISTFFLTFIILFSSCSQFYIDEENLEENLRIKATEMVSSINPDLITAEFFVTLEEMIKNDFHKQTSKEKAVFFNKLNENETFNSTDIEQMELNINEISKIQDQDELYKFAIENSEFSNSSKAMQLEIKSLFELGNTDDNERIKSSLQNWSNNVKVNDDLSKEEKISLVNLESTMVSFSQITDQIDGFNFDEIGKRGACFDCIKKNKRKIFGFGAGLALILVLACIGLSLGIGTVGCIAAGFGLGTGSQILLYCGNVCLW